MKLIHLPDPGRPPCQPRLACPAQHRGRRRRLPPAPSSTAAQAGPGSTASTSLLTRPRAQASTTAPAAAWSRRTRGICVGNGYVVEAVNNSFEVLTNNAVRWTPPIPTTQFFNVTPAGGAGASSFVSDPRCYYDDATQRWFFLSLEIDEASGTAPDPVRPLAQPAGRQQDQPHRGLVLLPPSTSLTDGTNGTPLHENCFIPPPSAGCLGDQPLIGVDPNGVYLSTNEFSYGEVLPLPRPPRWADRSTPSSGCQISTRARLSCTPTRSWPSRQEQWPFRPGTSTPGTCPCRQGRPPSPCGPRCSPPLPHLETPPPSRPGAPNTSSAPSTGTAAAPARSRSGP